MKTLLIHLHVDLPSKEMKQLAARVVENIGLTIDGFVEENEADAIVNKLPDNFLTRLFYKIDDGKFTIITTNYNDYNSTVKDIERFDHEGGEG
jgi:hypothetical protein